jgi:glutaredoxin 3
MSGKSIVLYSSPWCGYCTAAKHLLESKGVSYEEIDVSADARLRAEVVRKSGRMTVPQVFVDGVPHGGYDDLSALDRDGRLDAILGLA